MDELTGFGAISGHVIAEDGTVYAVSDSFYGLQPRMFHIDISQTPARIIDAIDVTREGRPAQLLDMQGITLDGDGGFWITPEGLAIVEDGTMWVSTDNDGVDDHSGETMLFPIDPNM